MLYSACQGNDADKQQEDFSARTIADEASLLHGAAILSQNICSNSYLKLVFKTFCFGTSASTPSIATFYSLQAECPGFCPVVLLFSLKRVLCCPIRLSSSIRVGTTDGWNLQSRQRRGGGGGGPRAGIEATRSLELGCTSD